MHVTHQRAQRFIRHSLPAGFFLSVIVGSKQRNLLLLFRSCAAGGEERPEVTSPPPRRDGVWLQIFALLLRFRFLNAALKFLVSGIRRGRRNPLESSCWNVRPADWSWSRCISVDGPRQLPSASAHRGGGPSRRRRGAVAPPFRSAGFPATLMSGSR